MRKNLLICGFQKITIVTDLSGFTDRAVHTTATDSINSPRGWKVSRDAEHAPGAAVYLICRSCGNGGGSLGDTQEILSFCMGIFAFTHVK